MHVSDAQHRKMDNMSYKVYQASARDVIGSDSEKNCPV